jgi:hypothetical protein
MIVELRTYRTKTGMRDAFLELFRSKTVPEHERLEIPIVGPFLSIEDDNTFFFMRGFPDEDSREASKSRFYEGSLWKEELEGVLMPMLERYDVVIVNDPEGKIAW